jgi:hypothetical protein
MLKEDHWHHQVRDNFKIISFNSIIIMKDTLYCDILKYFIPVYNQKIKLNSQIKFIEFIPEENINIKGIVQYRPYNIEEINKFKKFIRN